MRNTKPAAMDPVRRKFLQVAAAGVAIGGLGLKPASSVALGRTTASQREPAEAGASSRSQNILEVVIVGAGLSGLTTARDLKLSGLDSFVVLEARNRVGGRTFNHDLGHGQVSDAGGQWFGPGQSCVEELSKQLSVGSFHTYYEGKTMILGGQGRMAVDLKGGFGMDGKVADALTALAKDVNAAEPWKSTRAAELDRINLGEWLVQQGIKPADRFSWNLAGLLTGGSSPGRVGLLQFLATIRSGGRYEKVEEIRDSAQESRFVGGSQLLSIRMAEMLGDHVRLASPVRRIENWNGDIVSLHTDQGELRARRVVMALHPALCNKIEFSPALPDRRAALQRDWPAIDPLRKTAMVYARPFWRDKGLSGSVLQVDGPILWAYDNSPPRGEIGVINAFVNAGQLPSEPKAAQRIQSEIYARALGPEALKPLSYHDHDWAMADEWGVTCLPAYPPGYLTTHGNALLEPCGHLIWSGTETASRWTGYMDGAVSAGHRTARQLLDLVRIT